VGVPRTLEVEYHNQVGLRFCVDYELDERYNHDTEQKNPNSVASQQLHKESELKLKTPRLDAKGVLFPQKFNGPEPFRLL
jgi:hypothetical protein